MSDVPKPRVVLDLRNGYDSLREVSNEYLAALTPPRYRRISVQLRGADPQPLQETEQKNIPAERVVFLGLDKKTPFWRLRAAWRLRQLCREEQVELVIAHRFKSHHVMGLLHLIHPHFAQLAVVHGLRQINSRGRRLITRWLLGGATFVGVSEAVVADLRHSLKLPDAGQGSRLQDFVAVHNSMDIDAAVKALLPRTQAREKLGLSSDDYVIGHVARLSNSKDQSSMLRAFAHFLNHHGSARLVIVGDGPQRQKLINLVADLQVEDRVTFTGWHENAATLMAAFDQFVLTSVAEGFGMVLVEAMVARVPLVVTDAGGIGEVVGECCPLIRPGDVSAIAEEMVRVASFDDTEKQRLGEQMFQRAEALFSRPAMRRRIQDIVDPLLS